jgi:hypothetical protein
MSEQEKDLELGLTREDPMIIARSATFDELERLRLAEELLEKRHQRKKRSGRLSLVAQALVGYVALAGFFANAYQNWNNKKQAEERAHADEERWSKEFKRAQDADKYRAFFETSALATDGQNPDKRLVGYALLKEFVDDKDYNSKATFMLEESLALELRSDTAPGLDEPHRAAVVAILSALSHTSDCHALARATKTVEKLARRQAQSKDIDEAREVLNLYIVRIVGRAAEACTAKDLLEMRKPIRDVILHQPAMAGLKAKPTAADADHQIAHILQTECEDESNQSLSQCGDLARSWKKLCDQMAKEHLTDGAGLCAVTH